MDWVRKYYNLPFLKRGMRVEANGKSGVVTSVKSAYVRVKLDEAKKTSLWHPTWNMKYFDENNKLLKECK